MIKKAKKLFNKKIPRIIFLILCDIFAVYVASVLTIWIRFDMSNIPQYLVDNMTQYVFIDAAIAVVVFALFGLYTSIWKYASVPEFLSVIFACIFTDLAMYTYKHILDVQTPRSFWFIFGALLIILIGGIRFSYRIARTVAITAENRKSKKNIMIVGGGDAARMLIDEIARNRDYADARVACIIDDDRSKQGSRIHNIPIVGGRHDIQEYAHRYDISEIIIAIPSASKETISKFYSECQKAGCETKILPSPILPV